MSKIEIILVILVACSILAYLYVNVIAIPSFEERIYEFKDENATVLEEGSSTINNGTSVGTGLNSTIVGGQS